MQANVVAAISGSGRSLANLLENQEKLHYNIVGIISSNPDCRGNQIALDHGLPLFIDPFKKDLDIRQLQLWLKETEAHWIALAGFLRKFPQLPEFQNRVINIHPSLLPAYGGKGLYGDRVHKAVFEENEVKSGATIHFVSDNYDDGPIIAQISVDITQEPGPQEIARKVFEAECFLYPQVLDKLVTGDLGLNKEIWYIQDRQG